MKKWRRVLWVLWLGVLLPDHAKAKCKEGNCHTGLGTWVYPSGAVYKGHFNQGKRQGHGSILFTDGGRYLGDFHTDLREGQGTLHLSDGSVYRGSFKRDRFHGKGEMVFAHGVRYLGDWASGFMDGQGLLEMPDGTRYNGQFKAGHYHGSGEMHYANGDIYRGEWAEGFRSGRGTLIPVAGASFQASWIRDRPSAIHPISTEKSHSRTSIFVYKDGSQYNGTVDANGLPLGIGICRYADGDRYEGGWAEHRPHGEGILYRKDGRIIHGHWVNGIVEELYSDSRPLPDTPIKPVVDPAIRTWAVVVGVGTYTTMPPLKYTESDAREFAQWLLKSGHDGVSQGQIRLLTNKQATRDHIIEAMIEVLGKADANDIILFYFSGHGLEGALLPVDFDGWDNRLYYHELFSLLDRSQARHKLVIADACYAGGLHPEFKKNHPSMGALHEILVRAQGKLTLLLSSKPNEYSLEDAALRSGVFSHYLQKGLRGEADTDNNGTIQVGELFEYVHRSVQEHTKGRQHPLLYGIPDEKLIIATTGTRANPIFAP